MKDVTTAHVALVAPGKPSIRKVDRVDYICPAVAQQGSKSYLYGITAPERQTMAWSWGPEAYINYVKFYVKK